MKPTLASRLCHWAIPVLLATTLPVTSQADDMDSADSWFQNSYGPLWADAPFDNIDAILDHYSAEIVTHSSDGAIHRTPRREWLMVPMDSWQAEGWLRAEPTDAQTTNVNATTASIMTTGKTTGGFDRGQLRLVSRGQDRRPMANHHLCRHPLPVSRVTDTRGGCSQHPGNPGCRTATTDRMRTLQ